MNIISGSMPHCCSYATAEEFETAYKRELLKRVRRNAQTHLREIRRLDVSGWTAEELEKLEEARRGYAGLVAAIKPPSCIRSASLAQLWEMIDDARSRVPGFFPDDDVEPEGSDRSRQPPDRRAS